MEHKGNSGFMSGLLLGVILGASVVFLLGTKKGKKILDTLTEEGLSSVEELSELLEETIVEEQAPQPKKVPKVVDEVAAVAPVSVAERARTATKRLFKGIPRRR